METAEDIKLSTDSEYFSKVLYSLYATGDEGTLLVPMHAVIAKFISSRFQHAWPKGL